MPKQSTILARFRDALATVDGTALDGNILSASGKVYPIPPEYVGAVLIYPVSESVESQGLTFPRTMLRQLTISVEVIARNRYAEADLGYNIAEDVSGLSSQVETLLAAQWPASISQYADAYELVSSAFQFSGDGNEPFASVRMEYLVTYRTRQDIP